MQHKSINKMTTDYNKQATDFLTLTNTHIYITKAEPQNKPLWIKNNEKHGIDYSVKLRNAKHEYNFHFWDSIANKEQGKTPSEYDILACLIPTYENTFEDFCLAVGYDTDSTTALKTFEACKKQTTELKKLFTEEELQLLTEIQ